MPDTFTLFKEKLNEIFQMDRAELDFGIYRIMNVKRREIERYIDEDLLPQVGEVLKSVQDDNIQSTKDELAKLEEQLKGAGVDPSSSPKVQELRARVASTGGTEELRQRAFSLLLTFFSRYYDKGDFISKRRYKNDTYMIPYNGEEVKLVWANMDQYYVKTSEYLRDYRFFLDPEKRYRMSFKLAEGDVERDNIKGKSRIFELRADDPVALSDEGLVAFFTFSMSDRKQADALSDAYEVILANADGFRAYLEREIESSGKKLPLLRKHLSAYTRRNTEDYFIHKDLGGFLTRELDFFLKNEVLKVDELIDDSRSTLDHQIHLARAIKRVGEKLIRMLHQVESFQKKLWLKKKFVTRTDYLVTIDRVMEAAPELLDAIAANEDQREEWKRLFAIQEIKPDKADLPGVSGPAYSEPLTVEFLKANDKLVVDTRFFDDEFKWTLLQGMEQVDEKIDGLLVHSENFQALQLLQERYRERVKCVYIDPPYNTGADGFAYKDGYRHSSWQTAMQARLSIATGMIKPGGYLFVSIDDNEQSRLDLVLSQTLGESGKIAQICHKSRDSVSNDLVISGSHNSLMLYTTDFNTAFENRYSFGEEQDLSGFSNPDNDPRGPWKPMPTDGPGGAAKGNPFFTFHGVTGFFRYSESTMNDLYEAGELIVRSGSISRKNYLARAREKRRQVTTWWDDVGTTTAGTNLLKDLFGEKVFSNPKPLGLLTRVVTVSTDRAQSIMDFFAGSGTTGHAVINLNREDDGHRKYILVEMGEYFDTVLKPRIAKVVYSADWKNGKPQSRDSGVSQVVKVIRLESYEDTLNNLQVAERGRYSELIDSGVKGEFSEGYMLDYMLDWEAGRAGLSVETFRKPFDYHLNIATDTVGESRPTRVDLVETFNYLVGLTVEHISTVAGCRVVEGRDPAGDHVLVVWRDQEETGNEELDELFRKQRINVRDREFDLIYVNGDNNLENLKRPDDTWKVRLIEHEFMTRMFDVADL